MGNTNDFFKEKKGWSLIKDSIVGEYLTPYISKVLSMNAPLTIVDCFAGMGKFEDGNIGSPLIIGDRIKNILEKSPLKEIDAYFIEKKYHKQLRESVQIYRNCNVLQGTFEDNTDKILSLSKNRNIFLYIDPYGIKSLDFERLQSYKKANFKTVEMLINFNSFGFLREGCKALKYNNEFTQTDDYENYEVEDEISENYLTKVAGGSYWVDILKQYNTGNIDMLDAEEMFMKRYLETFNRIFDHVLNIPIKTKIDKIPKYRMVFGSNHPDGLILMANNMHKNWKKIIEEDRGGQVSLFETNEEILTDDCINKYEYPDYTKDYDYNPKKDIIELMEGTGVRKDGLGYSDIKDIIVFMIKRYGITYSEAKYKEVLKELESEDVIEVKRDPELTKGGRRSKSYDYSMYKIKVRMK